MRAGTGAPAPQDERAVRILSVDDTKRNIGVIAALDARPEDRYLQVHLPYALQIDIEALEAASLAPGGPDTAAVLEVLSETSASTGKPFLIYGDPDPAIRRDGWMAWLAAHAGLPEVAVLDGSVRAWLKRRSLAIQKGYPILRGALLLREKDLRPRDEIRIDPASADAGENTLEILPPSEDAPVAGSRTLRADELLDEDGHFLYPDPLKALLSERGVDPGKRIALHGEKALQGLAWTVLAGNGFDAAVVVSRRAPSGEHAAD